MLEEQRWEPDQSRGAAEWHWQAAKTETLVVDTIGKWPRRHVKHGAGGTMEASIKEAEGGEQS